jgi:pimeloyl-ACP methyl ester carboxylesterase
MAGAPAVAVLVHGLWMHGVVMELQRRYLAKEGIEAVCYSYPSRRLTLTQNADRLVQFARSLSAATIHWVGHSLGGLIILRMLERESTLLPGRAVLLGPPYAGTYAGDALARSALGTRMLGLGIPEWPSLAKQANFPGRDIGVIAGNLSIGLGRLAAPGLPRPNDGAVAVVETLIPAACDRIELPVSHTGMLFSRRVAHQTAVFLRAGRFDHKAAR